MHIGIAGSGPMAATWHKYLESGSEAGEISLLTRLDQPGSIDACIVLANQFHDQKTHEGQPASADPILKALKKGVHLLWVGALPSDYQQIKTWHASAAESGSIFMFALWGHYAPTTQWLSSHVSSPRKIHIHREWPGPKHTPDNNTLHRLFLEELSLCIGWMRSRPVSWQGDSPLLYANNPHCVPAAQWFFTFANGGRLTISWQPYGMENRHSRFLYGDKLAATCQINEHIIKKWLTHNQVSHTPELMHFDHQQPAQHVLSHFFRAVRTGKAPLFGVDELVELTSIMDELTRKE